jgi:hypothetical protein
MSLLHVWIINEYYVCILFIRWISQIGEIKRKVTLGKKFVSPYYHILLM